MIKYSLQCAENHVFDEWFTNIAEYDEKQASKMLKCPICGNNLIKKAIMAPAISANTAPCGEKNSPCSSCCSCPHAN